MFQGDHALLAELAEIERPSSPKVTPEAHQSEAREAVEELESVALIAPDRDRDDLARLGLLTGGRRSRGLDHFSLTGPVRHRPRPRD